MMERLLERAEGAARKVEVDRIQAIAKAAVEELSGVSVVRTATGVVLRGRHLLERWLLDPALRFIGSLPR